MKKLFLLLLMIAPSLMAQSMTSFPAGPLSAPAGTYQSVTMPVVGLNNKTVLFTTDCGTIYGTNPSTSNEPATVALYSATAQTCHLTGTSTVNSGLHQTLAITFTASPTPATDHPRLYITSSMLSNLQAKFTAGSPMATNLHTGNGDDYGGVTWYNLLKAAPYNWSFTCESGTGLPSSGIDVGSLITPAETFALLNMVNYNTSAGTNWACYAHDVWVYAMNQMVTGAYVPAEDGWRGSSTGYIWTTDWSLYSVHPALSASGDVTLARQYIAWLLKFTLTNGYGGNVPTLTGPYNSSSMFLQDNEMRNLGNNYSEARFFYLAAAPLTFNDNTTDDPPLTNTCSATRYQVCADGTAGSMHAYFHYFTGAYLYDQYAVMEDPNVGWQAYQNAYANLPTQPMCFWANPSINTPCFGTQRGGEPAEGSGYGYSVYAVRDGLNSIHTAGYDDPTIYGPQMSLGTSSWWDMRDVVTNEFLTGDKANNGNPGGVGGIQPAYAYLHTGDSKHYYASPSDYLTETAMLVSDTYTGRTDRTNALLWPVLNTAFGGPAGTALGCNTYCGINGILVNDYGEVLNPDLFIALAAVDPGTLTPTDPRPSMPTDLYNGSYNQHQMIRSGFTNTDSLLSTYCENSMIDHEHASCGGFEVYANNEYITKGRVTFDADYNEQMANATQNNQFGNWNISSGIDSMGVGQNNYWWYAGGGLWQNNSASNLVSLYHSELPAYASFHSDNTPQYNLGPGYAPNYVYDDITGASRSFLYLRASNQIVTYDRGSSTHASPKAVYMNTTGTPTVSGNMASWLTQSGLQKAYWTSLLPATLPGTGGQLVNALVTNPGTTCTPTISVPGSGQLVASSCGANLTSAGVGVPGNSYSSPPTVTVNDGAAITAVVNSTTAVLNNVGLTYGPNQLSDWELAGTLQANCGTITSCNLLNVLEWGSNTFTKSTTTAIASSSGQAFDGASIGTSCVMFMRTWPASFTGTTYPASNCTTHYVSDLTPSTTYTVTGAGTPGTVTTDEAGVAAFSATGTGNISLSSGGTPTAATPTFSPVAGPYTGTQSVTISTSTAGATLCYTVDGTTPTANGSGTCTHGTTYSTAVSVASSLTLKAVASEASYLDSGVGSAAYTITTPGPGGATTGGNSVNSGSFIFQ